MQIWAQRMGNSRKYPCHTREGFSEFQGQEGVLWTGNRRHKGILTIGIQEACGGFRCALSTGNRQEFIPLKTPYFMDLISSETKHELIILLMTMEAENKTSIYWSVMFRYSFIETNKTGFYIKLQRPNAIKHVFFFVKTAS